MNFNIILVKGIATEKNKTFGFPFDFIITLIMLLVQTLVLILL